MGIGFIKSSEYESWARNNRVQIGPSEITVLRSIDREFVAYQNEKSDPNNKSKAPAAGLGADLSARARAQKEGGR